MTYDKSGYECGVCGQKLSSYKAEDGHHMTKHNREKWTGSGPGPEKCAIVSIEL